MHVIPAHVWTSQRTSDFFCSFLNFFLLSLYHLESIKLKSVFIFKSLKLGNIDEYGCGSHFGLLFNLFFHLLNTAGDLTQRVLHSASLLLLSCLPSLVLFHF